MRWPLLFAASWVLASTSNATADPAEAHPMAGADNCQIHPALEITLFAREPDVVDPVALTFDEHGRAYVVEMRDYPYGFGPERRPGGTVRLLEDRDGDGRADRSVVFARGLSFPTSITAWNGGVLVAAPPDIVFLKDTDDDGVADVREIVITGFILGVTDSNANGLRWGIDNWVHCINGGNGGSLSSPRRAGSPALSIGDRDVRFRPATGEIERTSHTGGGFGLVFDNWGRSFTTHNINHIQQRFADADSFEHAPGLPPIHTTRSISDHGDMARIFPISVAQTRPNHPEQAGHFSSAGGMGYIGHAGWPVELQGSVLVCDVVGNIVHRDVLAAAGPVFRATRAPGEQNREFFASRDNSFRPVGIEQGPDGALYLLDMQRDVIEHPDYIPAKLLEKQDVRAGDDRGRIYRIMPRDRASIERSIVAAGTADPERPGRERLPGRAEPRQLVDLLRSPNPWTRITAQRLLVSQECDAEVVSALRRMIATREGDGDSAADAATHPARLHALWTLAGLEQLDARTLEAALRDPVAGVREGAVRALAEARIEPGDSADALRERALEVAADRDPQARFAGLLSLADRTAARWIEAPRAFLLKALHQNRGDALLRRAVLACVQSGEGELLEEVLAGVAEDRVTGDLNPETLRELAALVGARLQAGPGLSRVVERLRTFGPAQGAGHPATAVLEGLHEGIQRNPGRVALRLTNAGARLEALASEGDLAARRAAWRLAGALGLRRSASLQAALRQAARRATNATAAIEERIDSVRLLELAEFEEASGTLFALLDGTQPSVLQHAAFEVIRGHRVEAVAEGLIRSWPALAPTLRPAVVNLLVYRAAFHRPLLSAMEEGRLQLGELNLDLEHRRQLLRHAAPDIRARAAKFVSDEEYSNRKAIVDEWLARLPENGDPARGRPLFERICAQCHRAGDLGHAVGPDLTGVAHRSVEDLLSNILDPNMAMNPVYVAYVAELDDGEEETGILVADNPSAVTLLQAFGRTVEIPRGRIRQLRSGGRSLMPDGLETGLTPSDLRDLIAFLQETPPDMARATPTP